MPGLRQLQQERNFGLAQFTSNSCGPWLSVDVPGYPNCRSTNDEILRIVARTRPDVVLLHGRGSTRAEDIAGLKETILALRALSIPHIIVLGPVPVWKRGVGCLDKTIEKTILRSFRDRTFSRSQGHSRRFGDVRFTSAFPPIAEVQRTSWHFAFVPRGDVS
jgi:hypothetical protein